MSERRQRHRSRLSDRPPAPTPNRAHGISSDPEIVEKSSSSVSSTSDRYASSSSKKRSATGIALAMATLIGAALFFGLGGSTDRVTDQEQAIRHSEYTTLLAGAGMPLQLVTADEMDQAIESLPVTDEQRVQMAEKVSAGRLDLAWVTVWDTHAEDGDVLQFSSSASIPVEVTALNAKTTLAIPYPVDGDVTVTGVKDGGGGITIALQSGAAQIAWPTMQPGDVLQLPVTPAY